MSLPCAVIHILQRSKHRTSHPPLDQHFPFLSVTEKKNKTPTQLLWVFIFAFSLAISGTHKASSAIHFMVDKPQRRSASER